MRRLSLLAAIFLSAGQASGQEKYDFKPRVKAGDVFTTSVQRSETLDFKPAGLLKSSLTRSLVVERSILEEKDGKPVRFDERTVQHEDKMTGTLASISLDETTASMRGVKIRYELLGGEYDSMLIDGDLNPDVAAMLKKSKAYPLGENFLPTKPLAVGESQVLTDHKRLTGLIKEGSPVNFEEEPKMTLEKVATVDGVKTAFLKLVFRIWAETPEFPGKRETSHIKATILYDLDRGYLTRVEIHATTLAPGQINRTDGTVTADLLEVSRILKK